MYLCMYVGMYVYMYVCNYLCVHVHNFFRKLYGEFGSLKKDIQSK